MATRAALAVVAFGGSALMRAEQTGTHRDQVRNARKAAKSVVTLVREGFRVLVVHGNGPQVGRELLRNEESSTRIPPRRLDACVAATQGTMGYLLGVELKNEMRRASIGWPVSTVMTFTLVGLDDPAFAAPARPVGPYHTPWRARALTKSGEAHMIEESGRGWRRVVPTPRPIEVTNLDTIEALLDAGHVVIAGGGGGVPVAVDARGQLIGVEAIIDKDRTAALLADHLGAELLALLTPVDQIYANFGRTDQQALGRVTAAELRVLFEGGHFPAETMGPKVEAALEFVEDGGTTAIITSAEKFSAALADRAGTRISRLVAEGPVRRQISLFPTDPKAEEE